ncbi:MAG: nucleoside-diphosphate kinase [Planctomycetes bacterium RBG_16_55_9]|nr:MAG: nucleoside-diphosphate kinase [Planctomycetes bacterium RBG_16_55_9]
MAERTLVIIKPDGIQRHLAGQIITRFEKKGLKLVAVKLMRIPEELARRHYAAHQNKPFFEPAVKFMTSSPSLLMAWEADGVIEIVRKMLGSTFGYDAQPGTIRGDFGCSQRYNLIHGSDSPTSAQDEINLFFTPNELIDYEFSDARWLYSERISPKNEGLSTSNRD